MTDRIAGTFLMGLDVAVEFATLGEFRLVEADASPASYEFQAAPLVRRPANLTAAAANQALLPPASTAIARAAAESAARVAARRAPAGPPLTPGARMKPGAKAVLQSPPRRRTSGPAHTAGPSRPGSSSHPRKRAGAVEASTQLCLFNR